MKIYKQKEFAELINVSERTLVRWDEDKKFPARRNPSGHRFYTEEDFERYVSGEGFILVDSEALQVFIELAKEDIAAGKVSSLESFRERLAGKKDTI